MSELMSDKNQAIAEFWRVFQEREGEFAAVSTADHPLYDLMLDQLQQINPKLYFEFSWNPGASELIITADGNPLLFELVEFVVAAAPAIPGWSVFALKPKLGFSVTTTWEGLKITIADLVFQPLERNDTEELGIRIFVPGIRSESAEAAHNAILRALDSALGERMFSESVHYSEVVPLPNDVSPADHIPLTELENFINWRKKRQEGRTCQQNNAADSGKSPR